MILHGFVAETLWILVKRNVPPTLGTVNETENSSFQNNAAAWIANLPEGHASSSFMKGESLLLKQRVRVIRSREKAKETHAQFWRFSHACW